MNIQNEHLYADPMERLKKTNRYLFFGGTIVGIFYIVSMCLYRGMFTKDNPILIGVMAAIVIVATILGAYRTYINLENKERTKYLLTAVFLTEYLIANLGSASIIPAVIGFTILVVVLISDDLRLLNIGCLVSDAVIILKVILLYTMFQVSIMECMAQVITVAVLGFAINQMGHMNALYQTDILGELEADHEKQKEILSEVLEIAEGVQEGSAKVGEIVAKLRESSETLTSSVQEISSGNQSTCQNIEQQTQMTQAIGDNIILTADKSSAMVKAFDEVKKEVEKGLELMRVLDKQSAVIGERGNDAVTSMANLEKHMSEMRSFAEEIFSISSQTNLLALNASIEAARAGEAGKGFAVVAEEIRSLSEQTRSTTEKITGIIEELNHGTKDVSEAINASVDALTEQNSAVEDTGESFHTVESKMDDLNTYVQGINSSVDELNRSNNAIIDSISQLSAVAEEVTANSDTVAEVAVSNGEQTIKADELLQKVIKTSHKLDKYLEN